MPPMRVLVVDDSPVIRRMVTLSLAADPGLEVVGTAADGKLGLAKVAHLCPDLVILDVEMPVMDGPETLKVLRKTHPRLTVIMFSSLTHRGAAVTMEALTLGASDYAAKSAHSGGVEATMRSVREDHHGELGGLIAQHWQLPPRIVRGIIYHHDPKKGWTWSATSPAWPTTWPRKSRPTSTAVASSVRSPPMSRSAWGLGDGGLARQRPVAAARFVEVSQCVGAQQLALRVAGVLAGAVGGWEAPRGGTLRLDRAHEGACDQPREHGIIRRPAHDLAAARVQDSGDVEPAFLRVVA